MTIEGSPIRLPLAVHCPSCGRAWTQTVSWNVDDILLCECGQPAERDEEEHK